MPMYEFACADCDQGFEKLLSFSQADNEQECPECGGHKTARQLSSFAVCGGSNQSMAMSGPPASSPFT